MAFYIIAALIVTSAVLVIASRNPIVSAIWLVVCLFAQAALYVLMEAHLVAALQVLLYAGAIMVLILFVIMLLNLSPKNLKWRAIAGERIIIGAGAVYLAGVLGMALWIIYKGVSGSMFHVPVEGTIENVGRLLLTKYVVPFELISVTLLAAIVGAVVMSRK